MNNDAGDTVIWVYIYEHLQVNISFYHLALLCLITGVRSLWTLSPASERNGLFSFINQNLHCSVKALLASLVLVNNFNCPRVQIAWSRWHVWQMREKVVLILVLVLLQCRPSSSEVNTFYLLAVCNKSAASLAWRPGQITRFLRGKQ